jgi:hypothetical protein
MRLIQDHPERVGYLLKERVFDIATVVDALRRIVDGETVIDPTIVARLLGRRRRADPLEGLTGREREVLGLVAQWKGKYRAPLVGMPVPPPPHHRFCPSYRRCHGWRCGLGGLCLLVLGVPVGEVQRSERHDDPQEHLPAADEPGREAGRHLGTQADGGDLTGQDNRVPRQLRARGDPGVAVSAP